MSVKFNDYEIIRGPVITEKTTGDRMEYNKYSFYVDPRANKQQIKRALENLFNVKVVSVNTIKAPSKPKRMGRFEGRTVVKKKATVTLREGDRIKLMEGP